MRIIYINSITKTTVSFFFLIGEFLKDSLSQRKRYFNKRINLLGRINFAYISRTNLNKGTSLLRYVGLNCGTRSTHFQQRARLLAKRKLLQSTYFPQNARILEQTKFNRRASKASGGRCHARELSKGGWAKRSAVCLALCVGLISVRPYPSSSQPRFAPPVCCFSVTSLTASLRPAGHQRNSNAWLNCPKS